ncbi:hypothetical protein Droror1_Dr00008588 [Drosera rotundifolia]
MAIAAVISLFSAATTTTSSLPRRHGFLSPLPAPSSIKLPLRSPSLTITTTRRNFLAVSVSGHGGESGNFGVNGGGEGGGVGGGGEGDNDSGDADKARREVMMVLSQMGRSLESLPSDLAAAVKDGRIPAEIVIRYVELEKSQVFRWLLQFGGFRERLLADDLFLAKLGMECGVGIFTKTAAEYERRRENFFNELEIVFADVVMAIIADFMLVYLPAPTVSLQPSLTIGAGPIAKFFHGCPDNAFQVALGGASYSLVQRLGAIVRNSSKLFVVGTTSSLVGTAITNIVINARKAVDTSSAAEAENLPILSTSVGYGVYMAVSSNLRYQIVAGVIEQRMLEPLLHKHKLVLSALCFAVRTGNTYLGSLLWVDYARWIGIQKAHDEEND